MKKIIASAVGLMLAGGIATTASAALESQFGGYWRNRLFIQDNFDGVDSPSYYRADQRTRLYYTAKFSDDFKFVNKFEFNSIWGDKVGGDIGADGNIWVVKNSYADFNMGKMLNVKLGIQPAVVARGFIFDDDFSGAIATLKFGNVSVPLVYMSARSEDAGAQTADEDIFAALAAVKISDAISVTPYFVLHTISGEDTDNWYAGVDADMKFGSVSVWGTGIYNGGKIAGVDNVAFLGAFGVDAGVAHGQFLYGSGDDGTDATENNAFVQAPGSIYYGSEILGLGVFDNQTITAKGYGTVSNNMAANVGATIKPMDKLTLNADVWYYALAEENAAGDTELGIEFDGKVAYNIYDNLTAEYVFAYLVAGDAVGDEDIIETGVRFSLKF
ncbi:MAG: hypothetical protein KJ630_15810 [Proteobacteria bacterium]|nr:hypothetical protein [Pseudomonadota bacterium]